MIIGVGIDVAEIDRFQAAMERTPGMAARLFLEDELLLPSGERRGHASLAARFAAKEACMKALGTGHSRGVLWKDIEVVRFGGPPQLRLHGGAARRGLCDRAGLLLGRAGLCA